MDKILVLDFGGQYCHLISRRVRDAGVFSEVVPSAISAAKIAKDKDVRGIVLSGGARSVYAKNAPKFDKKILALNIPILGICYGHQVIAHLLGGKIMAGKVGEYGLMKLSVLKNTGPRAGIFAKVPRSLPVWMNHRDVVMELPRGFVPLASTEHSKIAAFAHPAKNILGVQFHPEVSHTKYGQRMLENFVFGICCCKKSWSSKSIINNIIKEAKETIGGSKAVIGLSGGIDSSVAAVLTSKAIGQNLTAVYVDTGLMRYRETDLLCNTFSNSGFKLRIIKAGPRFFSKLKGVISPEKKRKIIGKIFADIFLNIARKERADFLIQGTIYSDRIESGITQNSSIIKSHHNVGGLPKNLKLKLYEPLRNIYKDEVRNTH